MSQQRLSMKKLKEVFRLKFELSYSHRVIAQSLGISPATVSEYVQLLKVTNLHWEHVKHWPNEQLEQALYKPVKASSERPRPEYEKIHLELKRKGVTLLLLWREYKQQYPDGLGYTRFCVGYQSYSRFLKPIMRFNHKAGDCCYVDYAGLTMEWVEHATGAIHTALVFVGALGASHLIFCEATATQSTEDFLSSHVRMFNYFGGVPEKLVSDNLRTGVTKAHRYDPDLNQQYTDFAEHYGVAVLPARVREPTDKSKVEVAVQCVEREVIAVLRHQRFHSLAEVNAAIKPLLEKLNNRPMQKIKLSRYEQFNAFERTALLPLPKLPFIYRHHKLAKVHQDYHVEIDKRYYSVPYQYIYKTVDVYFTTQMVEIFYQGERVALHQRSMLMPYHFATDPNHMPASHRAVHDMLNDAHIDNYLRWAESLGETVLECVKNFFLTRTFPEHAIRAVLGLKRLHQSYGTTAFINACDVAIQQNRYRYQFIEEVLKHDLTAQKQPQLKTGSATYCRGKSYYE